MKRVDHFIIEESKVNKGLMILIAVSEDGRKWVCSGNHWSPTYLVKYKDAFDTQSNNPLKPKQ